ncbi:DNA-directed RNA polymerases II, IV and V subunit 8B isoform X2 [Populus alba]|uniref:DNA-directed RNA polymerases II, IV and V subunit 8B isoform X2 n=1 Tax=Populus alba TaxID=43335 RepID=UPI00158B0023|nr:DNA-directed RNA polymerases II, IV and V subunit 8B-like isoform X1 [Populus alba]
MKLGRIEIFNHDPKLKTSINWASSCSLEIPDRSTCSIQINPYNTEGRVLPSSNPLRIAPWYHLLRMEDLLDFYVIEKLNPDGKKYDKVSRIVARSEKGDLYMVLDVHTEIYPIEEKSRYLVLLTGTLNTDGTPVDPRNAQGKQPSKEDKFEYVTHGKLYKIDKEGSGADFKLEIYISFGGLQLLLRGSPSSLARFQLDKNYLMLMRNM